MTQLAIQNRIELLKSRGKDNQKIIKKLQRKLNQAGEKND